MRPLSVLLLVVAAAGCAGRSARTAAEPSSGRSPVRDSLFAVDAGRTATVRRLGALEGRLDVLADNVAYLREGLPSLYGKEAVRAVFNAEHAASGLTFRWEPLGGGISRDGRSGYTYGVAAVAGGEDRGAPRLRLERYIAYWTRATGSSWRIVAYAEVGRGEEGTSTMQPAVSAAWISPPEDKVSRKLAAVLDELRTADSEFSAAASRDGIAAAFAAWAAPTAVLFVSSELVTGPAAIRDSYGAASAGSSLAWHPAYAFAASSGDLGFTIGDWVSTGRRASGAVSQRFGKYLTVWRKQRDGRWLYVVDGGNGSPPPGGARASGALGQP